MTSQSPDAQAASDIDDPKPPASSHGLFFAVFPSILLPMWIATSDQTIVASALPAIAGSTGEVERISWVIIGYLLATTLAAPVYGYLGDVLGRRRLMFLALSVYMAASVLCSLAPGLDWLIVARLVQGLGGGGLMSLSQALTGEAIPVRERGHYQGYLSAVAMVGSTAGPLIGGFMTAHFGWRSLFLVNLCLGFVAMAMTFRLPARRVTRSADWRFDFGGLALFVAFIVPVLIALQFAQRFDPHALAAIAGLLALALASLVILLRHEARQAFPLLPVQLFRQRPVWMACVMAAANGAIFTALVSFLPIYLRVAQGAPPDATAMLLVPVTIGLALGSTLFGRLVTRTGLTMIFPSVGLIFSTVCMLMLAVFARRMSIPMLAGVISVSSFAMGSVMGVVLVTVQGFAGSRQLGASASAVQLSRAIGASFGTAVFGTLVFATLFSTDPDAGRIFGLVLDAGPAALNGLEPQRRAAIAGEIADAFRAGFIALAIFAATACLMAWRHPLRRV